MDIYQYPSITKRYVDIPKDGAPEDHALMRNRANNVLFQLKNYMKIGRLSRFSMDRTYSDGSSLKVSSVNGIDTIKYTIPVPVSLRELPEILSFPVMATCIHSEGKIFFEVGGNPQKNYYIDLAPIFPHSEFKMLEAFSILEYDARFGFLMWKDVNAYATPQVWLNSLSFQITGFSNITLNGYRKAEIDFVITKHLQDTGGFQFNEPQVSPWVPPYTTGITYFEECFPKGSYCWMEGGTGKISLDKLRWEVYAEVPFQCYYLDHGYWVSDFFLSGGIINNVGVWRTHNINPIPSNIFGGTVMSAYAILDGNFPKWNVLIKVIEFTNPPIYTQWYERLCMSYLEQTGYSPGFSDLWSFNDTNILPFHPIGGPGGGGRIGTGMPGGGDKLLNRYMQLCGSYLDPFPPAPPFDEVSGPNNKIGYTIKGIYYPEATSLSVKLPAFGKSGKELWEAKRFFRMRDKEGTIKIPVLNGYGNYTWQYPCRSNCSLIGRHPDYPDINLTSSNSGSETPASIWRQEWYTLASFGCVKQGDL